MEKRLPGKVRRAIRAKYYEIEPKAWVGKKGLEESVISEIDTQLKKDGILKVEIRKGAFISTDMDRESIAEKVAELTDSELIDVRGKRFILFRPREGWEKYLKKLKLKEVSKERREEKPVKKVKLDIAQFRKKFKKGRE
ncbi:MULTISPECIES: YhbY family RNA-binding protein [Thermococcus]|uniref:Putative RNA-binding protein, CRS1/YhbY family n=1 Tax=Thermococcus sibiricus TaxID=172049 RepID=A0A117L133_9EURY|nr:MULTISPECIES: YhbY family RNA-binding protein [Thermococcus]KUK17321.1 MAG: putative RNA-binding protein, CRS1/YhbY family [Thermococcus sibiricus]KUK28511.1 MAG: putative RNA-binding protein, CRS1/YhbY family [Thermococcus sp. 40_45]MBC7095868.1 YhbY family RNA-binding protein [Thermococcus sp.]HII67337.1 YhbY family RNA-binding protein [Thermococcaceae archaeon]